MGGARLFLLRVRVDGWRGNLPGLVSNVTMQKVKVGDSPVRETIPSLFALISEVRGAVRT